jgi:hypothetical protein
MVTLVGPARPRHVPVVAWKACFDACMHLECRHVRNGAPRAPVCTTNCGVRAICMHATSERAGMPMARRSACWQKCWACAWSPTTSSPKCALRAQACSPACPDLRSLPGT